MNSISGSRTSFSLFTGELVKSPLVVPKKENPSVSDHRSCAVPEVTCSSDGAGVGLIRPSPKVRHAVFQGGGVKGLCYPAFIRELGKEFLSSLHEVAGSSAGAIIAFLVASGLEMDKIQDTISNANILQEISGTIEGYQCGRGLFSGGNLMETLRRLSIEEPQRYYDEIKESPILNAICHYPGYDTFIEHAHNGFEKGLTFNDLRFLHLLNPEKFKELHVTAYDRKKKETLYYSADSNPDLVCHVPVRASYAIPFVFQPIYIDGRELSDGGEGSNVPLEVFAQREDYDPEETVIFAFDHHGKSHRILHDLPRKRRPHKLQRMAKHISYQITTLFPQLEGVTRLAKELEGNRLWRGSPPSYLKRMLGGSAFVEARRRDGEKIHSLLSNVFVVPHGQLKSVSFRASKEKINQALEKAAEAGRRIAKWRENLASYRFYTSAKEAVDSMSDQEKEALIEAGFSDFVRMRLSDYMEGNFEIPLELREPARKIEQENDVEALFEILRIIAQHTGLAPHWSHDCQEMD